MGHNKAVLAGQIFLLAVTAVVAYFLSRASSDEFRDKEDRNFRSSSACYSREIGGRDCETSFRRLMSGEISDRVVPVRLLGFLAIRNGTPMLFPDELSYRQDVVVDAIALSGSLKDFELLRGHWYTYVRVMGRFEDSPDVGSKPWFGELHPSYSLSAVSSVSKELEEEVRVDVALPH